ncbi:unnamed protein product [Peronospora belbahrii]|uniref:Uncharacterized protein n=1 Tax=Peronospora belbahrii TaxID=622444 RepID=A0ABN8CS83_9STRA|nr:unnamed protein product [Peronospora belbahrii]
MGTSRALTTVWIHSSVFMKRNLRSDVDTTPRDDDPDTFEKRVGSIHTAGIGPKLKSIMSTIGEKIELGWLWLRMGWLSTTASFRRLGLDKIPVNKLFEDADF